MLKYYFKRTALKAFFVFAGAISVSASCLAQDSADFSAQAKRIAIQHNGQVKSFESFAQQTLSLVSEKTRWHGKSATQTILEALAEPKLILDQPWIKVSAQTFKQKLGLPMEKNYFSHRDLEPAMDTIVELAKSGQAKRDRDIRPNFLEQKAENLYGRMAELRHLSDYSSVLVVPPASGHDWLPPAADNDGKAFLEMLNSLKNAGASDVKTQIISWQDAVLKKTQGQFQNKIHLEVLYHQTSPFLWSWMFYLTAFLAWSVARKTVWTTRLGALACLAGMVYHTAGLALRVAILGRPPVSNMFESIIFMNWILMLCAILFSVFKRQSATASIGAILSAIIMIYANLLPMDPSLEVLVPVLRSNYWLTIHVLTIVASYGVLGLAMGLGHRHLILWYKGRLDRIESENSAQLIYRAIQIGSLLLGIGTVLGGVWANESWGRFWGWDPKETWALITFLGYLFIIHLVHFRWISPFGLAVSSIVSFQLVLMTWYGVNFVLGRGLHSYGQGSGGAIWIIYYLLAETAFLIWIFGRFLFSANRK